MFVRICFIKASEFVDNIDPFVKVCWWNTVPQIGSVVNLPFEELGQVGYRVRDVHYDIPRGFRKIFSFFITKVTVFLSSNLNISPDSLFVLVTNEGLTPKPFYRTEFMRTLPPKEGRLRIPNKDGSFSIYSVLNIETECGDKRNSFFNYLNLDATVFVIGPIKRISGN